MNVNSEFEDNNLDMSIVKTVRNLKKKKSSQVEEVDELPSRSESTIHFGKKTPINYSNYETDANVSVTPGASVASTTTKKTRKTKGSNISVNGSITDNGFVSPTSQEGKAGVFRRLAMSKGQSMASRDSKKPVKKEIETNFFDSSYNQATIELVELVMNKSRVVKTVIESNNLSRGQINKITIEDIHFNLCLKMLLNQLYKDGEINPELKNIEKTTFAKLEKFIAEKMETKIKLDNLETAIEETFSDVSLLNQNRIAELSGKLSG